MSLIGRLRFNAAIRSGDAERVRALIVRGADVNMSWGHGVSPLIVAAKAGHASVVATLVTAGAEIDGVDGAGRSALMHAVAAGQRESARALLDAGANASLEDASGVTAADLARGREDLGLMKLLMAARAVRG